MNAGRQQAVDNLKIMQFLEETVNMARGHGADVVDLRQRLGRGRLEPVKRAEMFGQQPRGGLADLADPERVDKPLQRGGAAFVPGRDQIFGGFFAHALQLRERLGRERIQIGHAFDQAGFG